VLVRSASLLHSSRSFYQAEAQGQGEKLLRAQFPILVVETPQRQILAARFDAVSLGAEGEKGIGKRVWLDKHTMTSGERLRIRGGVPMAVSAFSEPTRQIRHALAQGIALRPKPVQPWAYQSCLEAAVYNLFFSLMMLAIEAQRVIELRLVRLAWGGEEGLAEAQSMVIEKIHAASEAMTTLMMGGSPETVIARYREHVAFNTKRLTAD
jgi:hypothetical protein